MIFGIGSRSLQGVQKSISWPCLVGATVWFMRTRRSGAASQLRFFKQFGVAQSTMSRIENGLTDPDTYQIDKIAAGCKMTGGELMDCFQQLRVYCAATGVEVVAYDGPSSLTQEQIRAAAIEVFAEMALPDGGGEAVSL